MGYHGGSLADLADEEPARFALHDMAEHGGERMTELAARYTPRRTGAVAAGWRQLPVERTTVPGYRAFRSGTENRHPRAGMVEHGVEPHVIRPKRKDALETPEGPRAEAQHPGYRGAHALPRAATELEANFGREMQPDVDAWAQATEAAAKRHPGIT